jgi:hypothetical protein
MAFILHICVENSLMPRISEQLRKDLFIESLRKRVRHFYIYGESHPSEKELIRAKLDGFLEAALLVKICSKEQMQQLIDAEHEAIFGLTRAQRSEVRSQRGVSDTPDWTPYEAPATERMSPKERRARRYGAKSGARREIQRALDKTSQTNG